LIKKRCNALLIQNHLNTKKKSNTGDKIPENDAVLVVGLNTVGLATLMLML